jgi:hypothetical protein
MCGEDGNWIELAQDRTQRRDNEPPGRTGVKFGPVTRTPLRICCKMSHYQEHGNGKVVPVLNYATYHEDVLGEWRYSSTHRPLTPRETAPAPIG